MLDIRDEHIVNKIIELQTSIIEGVPLQNIFQDNIDFFLKKSQADIITFYMHEHAYVKPQYILTRDLKYIDLLNKYVFFKKNFKWDLFVKNCNKYFFSRMKHEQKNGLYTIFKGSMTKKEAEDFRKEIQMKSSMIMPISISYTENIIGYVSFIFKTDIKIEVKQIEDLKQLFQIILVPFYDEDHYKMYSKCIRIDGRMHLLTKREKNITKHVLEGKSYIEIADLSNISINTVKKHMVNIFNKYNVNSKMELFNKLYIQLNP